MDNRNRRFIVLVSQIRIETTQLGNQKHSLIDNRSTGQGADIGILCGLLELSH